MASDEELLQRYTAMGDVAAFEEVVRRHAGMVYGAACRTVGSTDAHDVTQAVFVLMSQKAATVMRQRHVAGWLHRTTMYCAANVKKIRARRARYEREAGRMRTVENKKDAVELVHNLDEALSRLAKLEREAVLLRYLEGRTVTETAAALGVSQEAAGKRAGRGLEKLRAFFVKRGYVVATVAAVGGVLEAQAVPAPEVVVAGTLAGVKGAIGVGTTPILKGVLKMMWWMKVKVAALLCVGGVVIAGGGGVLVSRIVAARTQTAIVGVKDNPVVSSAVLTVPTRVATTTPSVLPPTHAQRGELAGTVVDESGKPIEGVLVDAWTWYPGNETHTDAAGRFRLTKLGLDDPKIEVRFSKKNWSPRLFPNEPSGVDNWVIVMGNKTYFEGNVLSPEGKPVADALVCADQGPKSNVNVQITSIWTEAKTDEAGHYRMYVEHDIYEIELRVPNVGIARLPRVPIKADEAKTLNIQLEAGITFHGNVLDSETHRPVAGVRFSSWQRPGVAGRSDKDGGFTIDEMAPGKLQLDVEAPGYARWWSAEATNAWEHKSIDPTSKWQRNFDPLEFDLTPDMKTVTIEVEKEVRIEGLVLDPDDEPVAGATVAPALTGTGNSLTGDTRFSVKSKKDGTFVMFLPSSGEHEYNLVVHDGGYEKWRDWANGILPPFKTKPGDVIKNVTIHLSIPASVLGHVVDAAGKPVVGRAVRAESVDFQENRYYDPTTRTDKDGNYKLDFIRAGRQFIQVAPFWSATQAPARTSKTITLDVGETKTGVDLIAQPDR